MSNVCNEMESGRVLVVDNSLPNRDELALDAPELTKRDLN